MDFTRPCGDLSVLEASIVRAVAGDGEEEKKNQPHMKHEENSPNMTKINVSYEKTGSSTDNDEYPSEKDRLYRKWEENENEDKGNINPENPESDCHLKISDKRCTSASSSSSSSDSSGGKNSKYLERRRLLSCISPEACREFALRRNANKNRNGNRFVAGDDEEEKDEEVEEKGIREVENKQSLENTEGCSINEDNILGTSPDHTINNCTSLESNIRVVSTEHYSDTNVVSIMKNSNVDTKKRKREINLLSDSSEDLIESVMGFGNFKTSYRR